MRAGTVFPYVTGNTERSGVTGSANDGQGVMSRQERRESESARGAVAQLKGKREEEKGKRFRVLLLPTPLACYLRLLPSCQLPTPFKLLIQRITVSYCKQARLALGWRDWQAWRLMVAVLVLRSTTITPPSLIVICRWLGTEFCRAGRSTVHL